MKNLSEYKEFFYRDRSLEELFDEEIWYKIYVLVYDRVLFPYLSEREVVTVFNNAYRHCVCWNCNLLSDKSEIDMNLGGLIIKSRCDDSDGSSALLEIACIYSVYLLHIKQLPKIPWRFDAVRRMIECNFDLEMELNLQDIQKIEGT